MGTYRAAYLLPLPTPQFNRRRVLVAAAIVSPFAIAAGLGVGKLYAIYNPVTFPEMCATTEPTGETSVSMGAPVEPRTLSVERSLQSPAGMRPTIATIMGQLP